LSKANSFALQFLSSLDGDPHTDAGIIGTRSVVKPDGQSGCM